MCISYSSMYIFVLTTHARRIQWWFFFWGRASKLWLLRLRTRISEVGFVTKWGYPTGPMMLNSMAFLWLENLRIVGPAGPDVKVWLQPPASCLCLSTIINGSRNNISVTIMSGLKTSFPEPDLVLTIFKPHAFDTTIESPYSHHLHPLLFFILLTTPSTAPSRAPRSRQGYGPAIASKICTGSWCPPWSKRRKSSRWAERWVVGLDG